MSFHFVSHPWHVQEMADGTSVKVSAQDLDESTIAILVDELFDLSMAEGRPNLFLDFHPTRAGGYTSSREPRPRLQRC